MEWQGERAAPLALVVDNDGLVRMVVREALELAGLEVCEAESGEQAVALFATARPDIVLLDVMMPGLDGFATCAKLRESVEGSRVPILIMTWLDDAESIARAYEQGATDFIDKPLNPTILSHRVRYMLRGSFAVNALRKSEERMGLAQRIAQISNWEWRPDTNQFMASAELCRLMGLRPQDFAGTLDAFLHLVHADDRGRVEEALHNLLTKRVPCKIEHRIVLPAGGEVTVILQAEALSDDQKQELSVVGTAQDITDQKQSEREIHRLAYFDSLTGLLNRVSFKDRVTQALTQARRRHTILATLFLDLDRFKIVNDTLGHNIGDLLLQSVADRLAEFVRPSDSVCQAVSEEENHLLARLGGDEFTVLLTNLHDVQDAEKIARRIMVGLGQPFMIDGHEIFVTASVGIAVFPDDGDSVDALLKHADVAMYRAKEDGRNNVQLYSSRRTASVNERAKVGDALRDAIEREEFALYYQPQVDLRTNGIVGAEVLVRWQHPQRGLLSPAEFLPSAMDTGLIGMIDEWVLRAACRQNQAWQGRGLMPVRVAVNVSHSLIHCSSLLSVVEEVLRQTGLPPACLELELTESIAMRNMDASIARLTALRVLGVQLCIDDFGTGYSSLSYLQHLPISRVKIDRSFIREIVTQSTPAPIALAIIALARSLNLSVLAEGVEQEAQRKLLLMHGCDEAQGYFFGAPMPAEAFAMMLPVSAMRRAG